MSIYDLKYKFYAGAQRRSLFTFRSEGRSAVAQSRGEVSTERSLLLITRVVEVGEQGSTLEICLAETPQETHQILLTSLGEVKPLKKEQLVPGAWYPVPERPVPVGASWKASSRPMHFSTDVPLTYRFRRVLEFPQGPRALIEWESQSLTVPAVMGGRYEFQARGSYQFDIGRGFLVTATTTVRRRDVWLEYTNESVSVLELQDVTDDLLPT